MSRELTHTQPTALSMAPDALRARMDYASAIAHAGLLPKAFIKNPANVLVAIETGAPIGLAPIQAMQGIAVINGKATLTSDVMAGLIRRAGHKLRITEDVEHQQVTAVLIRKDDPDFQFTATWNVAKAQQAGLWGSGAWVKYPLQMMRARAISEVARQGASEVLYGMIYTPEEMGAEVDIDGEVVEIQPQTPTAPTPTESRPPAPPEMPSEVTQPPQDATPEPEQVEVEVVEEPQNNDENTPSTDQQRQQIARLKDQLGMDDQTLAQGVSWATGYRTYKTSEMTVWEAQQLIMRMEERAAQVQPELGEPA